MISKSLAALVLLSGAPALAERPLIDIYRTIHANPELSHQEKATSVLVAQERKANGKPMPGPRNPRFLPDAKPIIASGVTTMTAAAIALLQSRTSNPAHAVLHP